MIDFDILFIYRQSHIYLIPKEGSKIHVPSQNVPVLCRLQPSSHIPVDLLQCNPSLQTPAHMTHLPFDTYVPSLQTVKKKTIEFIHKYKR